MKKMTINADTQVVRVESPMAPYFMKNKRWYRYDEEEGSYQLTKEAPPKAVKSYKYYYGYYDEKTNTMYEGLVPEGYGIDPSEIDRLDDE